jgi:predicted metal-dependent phosphoesterase TrpH
MADLARDVGVAALALTDHDCLDGWGPFREAASGFEPVCGVEVSARYDHADVHVIGLFVDPGNPTLARGLAKLAREREKRLGAIVARLRRLGLEITEDRVRARSPEGTLGRPHVAMTLVEMGVVPSVDEAFRLYLRRNRPGYVSKPGPTPAEAIDWIRRAAGVAVLAHPGLLRNAFWIDVFARAGLEGIEVWHPKHSPSTRATLMQAAERLDLVPTGGSDYHGPSVGDSQIGQEPVPLQSLEDLRRRRPRT